MYYVKAYYIVSIVVVEFLPLSSVMHAHRHAYDNDGDGHDGDDDNDGSSGGGGDNNTAVTFKQMILLILIDMFIN